MQQTLSSRALKTILFVLSAGLFSTPLTGCLLIENRVSPPAPLYSGKKNNTDNSASASPDNSQVSRTYNNTTTPPRKPGAMVGTPRLNVRSGQVRTATDLVDTIRVGDKPVTFSAEDIPLPDFINEVFGDILQLNYQLDPTLKNKRDLVTLRLQKPATQRNFLRMVIRILDRYGVGIQNEDNILFFAPAPKGSGSATPPLLVSGRALPDVPDSHRTVFQHLPLQTVKANSMVGWLKPIYTPLGVNLSPDITTNSLMINGPGKIVRQVMEAVKLLDQPSFYGQNSGRFELAFQSADKVKTALTSALIAEGYHVTEGNAQIPGSIRIIPVDFINSLIVFAADQRTLQHVGRWIRNLDQQPEEKPKANIATHYYEVKNTKASSIFEVLEPLVKSGPITALQASATTATPATATTQATAGQTPATAATNTANTPATKTNSTVETPQSRLVLDEARNAILFMGDPQEWRKIQQIILRMDRQVRQVLVEVTIAEVSLTDQENFGVEWRAKLGLDSKDGFLSTIGGLNLGGAGLLYTLESAGQTRAIINAMATNQQVSIVSTPKILVKSGESASIDVGSEVPIVSSVSTADSQSAGTSDVLQEIQYRKTGVLLKVTPVIHSGNRVDMEISQEVSEARENTTSNISSPSIFNRQIQTSVSLKDGGSLLLGGLITKTGDQGQAGVPVLQDLPIAGNLFKGTRKTADKRELLVLIRPYIIENDEQAYSITRSQQQQLQLIK